MDFQIADEIPHATEYVELRSACGLAQRTLEAAKLGLPRSLYSVTIRSKGILIGMGRIVGDLGCHVQITDIAIHPDFQRSGLGFLVMTKIMKFVSKECPECCYVNLFSDADSLYQKFGFIYPRKSKGMCLDWNTIKA